MKAKILFTMFLGILTIAFQNCERSPFIAYEGKIDSQVKSDAVDHHLVSLNYFRGGWFPAPGSPNWGNDVTIEEKNGTYTVSAKTTDSLCGKVSADLSEQQVADLKKLLAELDIQNVPVGGPVVADMGVRQITVQNLNEDSLTIQLGSIFESSSGLYATNGDALATYIEALDSSLAMYCQ